MAKMLNTALGGLVVAASLVATASPAEAQRYRRHHHSGSTLTAGIIGLGIGAAIASSNRGYYDPYYRGSYRSSYYNDGYYDRGYYDRGYYRDGYRRHSRNRCYTRKVWDPYYGRRVKVRYC